MSTMTIVWAVAAVLFLILEAATVGLASIWFVLGSLCALMASLFGAPPWMQVLWFIIISVATLIITRPLVKKYVNGKSQPTNADRVIGGVYRVAENVDNLAQTGAVRADGKLWTARSVDGGVIESGALVKVLRIEGVKLIVEKTN